MAALLHPKGLERRMKWRFLFPGSGVVRWSHTALVMLLLLSLSLLKLINPSVQFAISDSVFKVL